MPYLQVELDALHSAQCAAISVGRDPSLLIGRLVLLWAWGFKAKSETCTEAQSLAFFGDDALRQAASQFGFITKEADRWRIKGADRWRLISERRANAGKQGATSRWGQKRKEVWQNMANDGNCHVGTEPKSALAGELCNNPTGYMSAPVVKNMALATKSHGTCQIPPITSKEEEEAPRSGARARTPQKTRKPPAPDWKETQHELAVEFSRATGQAYEWAKHDYVALSLLLQRHGRQATVSAWKTGLAVPPGKWPHIASVAQLRARWNDVAALTPKRKESTPETEVRVIT